MPLKIDATGVNPPDQFREHVVVCEAVLKDRKSVV